MNRTLLVATVLATTVLFGATAEAQTIGCEVGGTGGLIPASGTGGGGGTVFPSVLPPTPGVFTINVAALPPGATVVTELEFFGLTHTSLSDVQLVLTDPTGGQHNVWCRGTSGITSCDFNGDYTLVAPCTGAGQALPATCTGSARLPPGVYDQFFGSANPWPSGTNGIFNTPLDSIPAATGVWTVTAYDWVGVNSGSLASFDICFGTPQVPSGPTAAPALLTPQPYEYVWIDSAELTWGPVACATSYEVELDGAVTAASGLSHTVNNLALNSYHNWRVRAVSGASAGPWSVTRYFSRREIPAGCNGPALTASAYTGGNLLPEGSVVFFDVDVLNPAGITVSEYNMKVAAAQGTPLWLQVWIKAGTHVGFEQNSAPWTLVSAWGGDALGFATPTLFDLPDFVLTPGVSGMALWLAGGNPIVTNGTGTNQFYANSDLTLTLGAAQPVLFTSSPISPLIWNGTLRYNCTSGPPIIYCTAGTTTNNCVAIITATGQPSVSFANPCVLNVSNVEGQKQGLIFYGMNNTGFVPLPWGAGSLCVKPPNQRTGTQAAGGIAGQCDGAFKLDWNVYQSANPGALGNPFTAGNKVYVQAWFRDPPAPKTTNLSYGLELTVVP